MSSRDEEIPGKKVADAVDVKDDVGDVAAVHWLFFSCARSGQQGRSLGACSIAQDLKLLDLVKRYLLSRGLGATAIFTTPHRSMTRFFFYSPAGCLHSVAKSDSTL